MMSDLFVLKDYLGPNLVDYGTSSLSPPSSPSPSPSPSRIDYFMTKDTRLGYGFRLEGSRSRSNSPLRWRRRRKKTRYGDTSTLDVEYERRRPREFEEEEVEEMWESKSDALRRRVANMSDVTSLLFTADRDYLLRYDNKYMSPVEERVSCQQLEGKIVIIVGLSPLPDPTRVTLSPSDSRHLQRIFAACKSLHSMQAHLSMLHGDVEVVVVMKVHPDHADLRTAYERFSPYNWLVVPFTDVETLSRLSTDLGLRDYNVNSITMPQFVLVGKDGTASLAGDIRDLMDYGPELYPFTSEDVDRIRRGDNMASSEPSLENLFSCSASDSFRFINLASGRHVYVPLSEFQGSLVGLFLCFFGLAQKQIHKAYESCINGGRLFKIVVIYPVSDMDEWECYDKRFRSLLSEIPGTERGDWLLLPFSFSLCGRVRRLFGDEPYGDKLVVMGDGSDCGYMDQSALEVMRYHGTSIESYPFTTKSVRDRALEKITAIRLESLLSGLTIHYRHGNFVPLWPLGERKVVLHFVAPNYTQCPKFRSTLLEWYYELKERDENFEVISVWVDEVDHQPRYNDIYVSFEVLRRDIPWYSVIFDSKHSEFVHEQFSMYHTNGCSRLVAFGYDGAVCSLDAESNLRDRDGFAVYPSSDICREVTWELSSLDYMSDLLRK